MVESFVEVITVRIHFVLNPRAGRRRFEHMASSLQEIFGGYDIQIVPDVSRLSIISAYQNTDSTPDKGNMPDIVVAVGGDGTVNRVMNTVVGMELPVGIIPVGSSNDLAHALGIPKNFNMACDVIKEARPMDIDLISVNGRYFATCGGLGMASHVADRANTWRSVGNPSASLVRLLGPAVYPLAALRELWGKRTSFGAKICAGKRTRENTWFNVFFSESTNC